MDCRAECVCGAPLYDIPGWDTLQLWFEGCLYDKARYLLRPALRVRWAACTTVSSWAPRPRIPRIRTVLLAEYYHLSEGLARGQQSGVYQGVRGGSLAQWYAELAPQAAAGSDYLYVSLTQPTITDDGTPCWTRSACSPPGSSA